MQATVEKVAHEFASHLESVRPGQPYRISEAVTPGDQFAVWQGDLCIAIVEQVPSDYVKVSRPKAIDKQLVPGNTTGARHCLDSLDGVKLYRPKNWTEESLQGPAFIVAKERTVTHPKHGDVTIPAGYTVLCGYQREFDAEQRRERRARD